MPRQTNTPPAFAISQKYVLQAGDYCGNYNKIGVCSIQGNRAEQQDAMTTTSLKVRKFRHLSFEAQKLALQQTFLLIHKNYGNHQQKIGATANCAIGWVSSKRKILRVVAANLGNSSTYVCIFNDEKLVLTKRIHELHHPQNPHEMARITNERGRIIKDRLNGVYNFTRTFGNTDQKYKGMSCLPDIVRFKRKLKENETAIVIVASDGLTLEIPEIEKIVFDNRNQDQKEIARQLIANAYDNSGEDNASVAVFIAERRCRSASVFDGNGGKDLAVNIRDVYYSELNKQITCILAQTDLALMQESVSAEIKKIEDEKAVVFKQFKDNIAHMESQLNQYKTEVLNEISTSDFNIYIQTDLTQVPHQCQLIFATINARYSILQQIHEFASKYDLPKKWRTDPLDDYNCCLVITFTDELTQLPLCFSNFAKQAKDYLKKWMNQTQTEHTSHFNSRSPSLHRYQPARLRRNNLDKDKEKETCSLSPHT